MINTNKTLLNSPLANKTYLVGGAVRDHKLGLEVQDMDYVVTVSQDEFTRHFPNAKMVGNSFPVYLIDGDEVALSRTERSIGSGYGNFELTGVGVPIEEDLGRRDFTINAMAINIVTNKIIDPFGGDNDLKRGLIRTTYRESFKDDPVRILRAIRFASRYNFNLSPLTMALMHSNKEELIHVTKERIVLEFRKVWAETTKPSTYFHRFQALRILDKIIPGLEKLDNVPAGPSQYHGNLTAFEHTLEVLDRTKLAGGEFHQGMAALFHDAGKAFTEPNVLPHHFKHEKRSKDFALEFFGDHKFSKRVNEFVPKVAEFHMKAHRVKDMSARRLAKLTLELGKRDLEEMVLVFNADHEFDNETNKVFDFMREVLYNTNFETLKDVPSNQRQQRAHQIRVAKFKQLKREK